MSPEIHRLLEGFGNIIFCSGARVVVFSNLFQDKCCCLPGTEFKFGHCGTISYLNRHLAAQSQDGTVFPCGAENDLGLAALFDLVIGAMRK